MGIVKLVTGIAKLVILGIAKQMILGIANLSTSDEHSKSGDRHKYLAGLEIHVIIFLCVF